MTVILHVGTHKTGTTTIQKFARKNAALLRDRGLYYPDYALIARPPEAGHHQFSHAIAGQFDGRRFVDSGDVGRFVAAIAAERRSGENVLISAEPIYRHILGEGRDIWAGKEAYTRALAQALAPLGKIVVVMCIRRQDSFALSQYQEDIKTTQRDYTFEQFLAQRHVQMSYLRHFLIYEAVLGAVELPVFEDLAAGDGLLANFFARIGVRLGPGEARFPASNCSLHPALIEYKRRLNASGLPASRINLIGSILPEVSQALYLDRRHCLVEPAALDAIAARYATENRILAKIVRGHSAAVLFPPRPDLPPLFAGLTEEESARIDAEVTARLPEGKGPKDRPVASAA